MGNEPTRVVKNVLQSLNHQRQTRQDRDQKSEETTERLTGTFKPLNTPPGATIHFTITTVEQSLASDREGVPDKAIKSIENQDSIHGYIVRLRCPYWPEPTTSVPEFQRDVTGELNCRSYRHSTKTHARQELTWLFANTPEQDVNQFVQWATYTLQTVWTVNTPWSSIERITPCGTVYYHDNTSEDLPFTLGNFNIHSDDFIAH